MGVKHTFIRSNTLFRGIDILQYSCSSELAGDVVPIEMKFNMLARRADS
jgi:hypothetical protein